ncbi:hypothetical protein ACFQ22_09200 [Lentilactobacillus raoultii]|uniref:Uncharacterized protein n=1 Tax=Lentilactobacillus raoultii TaxID=1987503 RepID=A0ABW3PMJ3_9LACO|nr:hypothetical protein [Lentilactobacillus raoultii]
MKNQTFKEALKSDQSFEDYLKRYFSFHKQLEGSYETREYFESYRVRLNKQHKLSLTTTTCLNIASAAIPLKQTENISFADFRRLVLNKKFADINATLAEVFEATLSRQSR